MSNTNTSHDIAHTEQDLPEIETLQALAWIIGLDPEQAKRLNRIVLVSKLAKTSEAVVSCTTRLWMSDPEKAAKTLKWVERRLWARGYKTRGVDRHHQGFYLVIE